MNLRQLKGKIKSIKNVGQITKAMQLVSAVKMKRAQERAAQGQPYRTALYETIMSILGSSSSLEHPLSATNAKATKKLAIVVSSNKGLCGIFNFSLFKYLVREIADFNQYDFIVMGLKAQQFLIHLGGHIVADFSKDTPFENNVTAIYALLKEKFLAGEYKAVELFSNRFISSLVSRPECKPLLPLHPDLFFQAEQSDKSVAKEYVVEPNASMVINGLFNFYLESEIRGAVQESEASEHSARMIAMKNATDNTQELVYDLTLLRNRIRQTRITNELLDMNTARLAVS